MTMVIKRCYVCSDIMEKQITSESLSNYVSALIVKNIYLIAIFIERRSKMEILSNDSLLKLNIKKTKGYIKNC